MNTITKKKILSPIVEVISELIVLNEEVTENNVDFPDITNFANAVSRQIEQVVKVGYSYMECFKDDKMLQEKMPIGCDEVLKASKLLIHSSELLKEDPKSKDGRDKLVESIQMILSGITKVLDIYDESEIRKIQLICQHIQELIQTLHQEKSVQESVELLRQLSQCSMALATQVNSRIPELLSQQEQLRLRIAVDTITKITPLLLNSYKVMLKESPSEDILSSKNLISQILQKTCKDVDKIVSKTTPEIIETTKGGILTQKMNKVQNAQFIFQQRYSRKQYKEAFNQLGDYLQSYNTVLDYIKDHLPLVYDPYQKQNISSTIALLKRKEVDFLELLRKCQKSNYPYSLRNQIVAELEYRTEYLVYLKDLFNKCVISSIVVISDEIADHRHANSILGIYVKHIKNEALDHPTLPPYHQQQLEYFNESHKAMRQLKKYDEEDPEEVQAEEDRPKIEKLEEEEDYPMAKALRVYKEEFVFILERVVHLLSTDHLQMHKEVILKKVSIIDQFYPLLLKTGYLLNKNTEDAHLLLFFDNVVHVWEYLVNDVKSYIINQEGVFSMKDLLDSSSLNINGHIKAFCRNDEANMDTLPMEYKSILATVNQLIDISKNECNNTEDAAYRDKLKKSIKEIKEEMKFIGKNMNNQEVKESTRATFEKLNEALSAEDTSILISDMTFADLSQAPLQQRGDLERLKLSEMKNRLNHLKKEVETLDQVIRINRKYAISKELPPTPPAAMKKSKKSDYLQVLSPLNPGGGGSGSGGLASPLSPLSPRTPLSPATPTRPQLRANSSSSSSSTSLAFSPPSSSVLASASASATSLSTSFLAPGSTSSLNLSPNASFVSANQSFYYESPLADRNAIIQPLNQEDAMKYPIRAVACDLKMAASKWKHGDNPIIEIVDLIAQKLDELAYYNQVIRSHPRAKKMLIRTAQEMMDKCKRVLNYAQEISATCTDKRLKLQLLNTVERINTIAQQLKVVVAVKSGGRFDMDGDKQLVTCASNLVEAVKSLLNDSEAAWLRSNYQPPPPDEKAKESETDDDKETNEDLEDDNDDNNAKDKDNHTKDLKKEDDGLKEDGHPKDGEENGKEQNQEKALPTETEQKVDDHPVDPVNEIKRTEDGDGDGNDAPVKLLPEKVLPQDLFQEFSQDPIHPS